MDKKIRVRVGEQPAPVGKEEAIAHFKALLEAYKIQNPVKYAAKEKSGEFEAKLAKLQE